MVIFQTIRTLVWFCESSGYRYFDNNWRMIKKLVLMRSGKMQASSNALAFKMRATRGREVDSSDEAFKSTKSRTLRLNAHAMILADVLDDVTSN